MIVLHLISCRAHFYNVVTKGIIILHFAGPPEKQGEPGPRGVKGEKGNYGGVTGGAVYTRWGRSDCPKSGKTTMLYSGK